MKNTLKIPILLSAMLPVFSGLSLASDDFAEGDLAVAFYTVTGVGSSAVFGTTYYLVNLGPATLYRENTTNNVPVKTINAALPSSSISADLVELFGEEWFHDPSLRWMVLGSVSQTGVLTNGDPARTSYWSIPRGSLNSGQIGPAGSLTLSTVADRTGLCNSITDVCTGANWGIHGTNGSTSTTGLNAAAVRLTTANNKSLDDYVPPFTTSTYFTLGTNPTQSFAAATLPGSAGVEGALDIFRVLHNVGGVGTDLTTGSSSGNASVGVGQFIGSLTIDSTGTLKIQGVGVATGNFASWAATNGVTGGVNGDSDNDGIKNLVEYALALNPAASDGTPGTFNGSTVTFTKRALAVTNNDVVYTIQESDDLGITDAWQTMTPTSNTTSAISYQLPPGGSKKFARLVVTSP